MISDYLDYTLKKNYEQKNRTRDYKKKEKDRNCDETNSVSI